MKRFRESKVIYFILSLLMVFGVYSLNTKAVEASETGINAPTVLIPYQEVTESGTYIVPSPGRIECTQGYRDRLYPKNNKKVYGVMEGDDSTHFRRVPAGEYEFDILTGDKMKFIPELASEYEQEDNDSFDTANVIMPNMLYKGGMGSVFDKDYYKIVITEKGSLYTELSIGAYSDNDRSYMGYELYSELPNGNLEQIAGINGASAKVRLRENYETERVRVDKGVYYIKISTNVYNYSLKAVYKEEAGDEFELEKNDTKDTANKITLNKKYTGNLNELVETESRKIIDEDYYKFTLESTGKAQLQMVTPRQKAKGLFTAELLNENGKVLDKIKSEDNPAVYGQEKVLTKGDYYIRVYDGYDYISDDAKHDSHVDYSIMCAFEEKVLADEVKITGKKTKFKVGDKYTLTAKISPENASDKTIVWKSLDTKIATIDKKGILKCKKAGEVIIRATSKESPTVYDEIHIVVKAVKKKKVSKAKYTVPEKIYNKIKGWYSESSSAGYDVKVTRDYFIKYDRTNGKVSSRWKIKKMNTTKNSYRFCVKYQNWEVAYVCNKGKLGEGFEFYDGWDEDPYGIGYSGSASLSKGKWGSSE